MTTYDAIVLGCGGIGSGALAAIARRGARVLGLDRFPPAHDRGSSHGRTRMIRQAYFEHPDYVPLVLRAYELWAELAARTGRALFRETGLLEVGPPDGEILRGVLASAREHRLEVEPLTASEIARRFPAFCVPEQFEGVFERRAGCLAVESCVQTMLDDAVLHGAKLRTGETVMNWQVSGAHVEVETERGRYSSARLVIAAGAWAGQVLRELSLPLVVRRKPQYWFAASSDDYRVERGMPAFLFELPHGVFYGFPRLDEWGVKVAEHSGGNVVHDPLALDRDVDAADAARVEAFCAEHLPGVTRRMLHHAACMYTLTPDAHFIVDRHPRFEQVALVAGLSGHGFKFAPVLGEALADLALAGRTELPIGFLGAGRFSR